MTSKKTETTQPAPKPASGDEKLQKVLARAGLGSRRELEKVITAGRVTVNGRPAKLGDRVRGDEQIALDGRLLKSLDLEAPATRVLMVNKAEGVICTTSDPEGRPTVFEGLPKLYHQRWVAVGRLDINTSGLLLLTNDGELANRLMHPSGEIEREYRVRLYGDLDEAKIDRLLKGVELADGVARFSDITIDERSSGKNIWATVTLCEGRNREVRRLWESQDMQVSRLKRVRYGPILLPSRIKRGQWGECNANEVAVLLAAAKAGQANPRRAAS